MLYFGKKFLEEGKKKESNDTRKAHTTSKAHHKTQELPHGEPRPNLDLHVPPRGRALPILSGARARIGLHSKGRAAVRFVLSKFTEPRSVFCFCFCFCSEGVFRDFRGCIRRHFAEFCAIVAELHSRFAERVYWCRATRAARLKAALEDGILPGPLPPSTATGTEWTVPPLPEELTRPGICLLYTSPSPRDATLSRMPSSA